jgi:hypothetical protein
MSSTSPSRSKSVTACTSAASSDGRNHSSASRVTASSSPAPLNRTALPSDLRPVVMRTDPSQSDDRVGTYTQTMFSDRSRTVPIESKRSMAISRSIHIDRVRLERHWAVPRCLPSERLMAVPNRSTKRSRGREPSFACSRGTWAVLRLPRGHEPSQGPHALDQPQIISGKVLRLLLTAP